MGGAGTTTSALVFGGYFNPPATRTDATESWNGSAWTEVANLNTGRMGIGGVGASNTDALAFGGSSPPVKGETESWNGSAWTEVSDLNTARETGGSLGTSTAALYVAGYTTDFVAITEEWSGSSWAEVADLSTARGYGLAGGGTTTAGFVAGGQTAPGSPNVSGLTEEWNPGKTTKTIDTD